MSRTSGRKSRQAASSSQPTMADIARLAGVSVATVSRAMSGSPLVSDENKERVAAAVKQTGYVVNQVARGLRLQRSGIVLVLVPNIANPFFSAVLLGIEDALQEAGLGMLVGNTNGDHRREASLARSLLTGGADGIILLTGHYPDSLREAPRAHGRLVAVSERLEEDDVPCVTIDNVEASRTATEHLLALGHRRIAHLAGPPGNILTALRLRGYHEAMARAGQPVLPEMVLGGDFSIAAGEAATAALLALPEPPTAVVCANDDIAIGAMKAARERGVAVPAALSVTGFDDIEMAYAVQPALTTIRQPREDFGRTAARMLLSLLDGKKTVPDQQLNAMLIARASTAPAP